VFTAAQGDPWFVRGGDYVGVGSSLSWEKPLAVPPGEGPRRRIITIVADGTLDPRMIADLAEAVIASPASRED
jgi:hypothetical protein